jgi:hypothetical protein
VRSQDDTRPATKRPAPSSGGGPARTEVVSRSAADAAADASQRRLVQLSLLLCPGLEDEPAR